MLLVLAAIVWAAWYFAGLAGLDPATITRLRLNRLADAAAAYAARHGQLPGDLDDLGPDPLDGKPFTTTDGWGRPILYRRLSPEDAELRSAGPDGQPSWSAATAAVTSPPAEAATRPADRDDDLVRIVRQPPRPEPPG